MSDDRLFVFLGTADVESATSKLKTMGITYKTKKLMSSVENYRVINRLIRRPNVSGVALKLTPGIVELLMEKRYEEATIDLMNGLEHVSHICFIHQTFLSHESDGYGFGSIPETTLKEAKDLFEKHQLNIAFYKTNAELSILASGFVDQNDRNLIFRIYLSKGRLWADEAGRIFSLFKDYLTRVGGIDVRQEQFSTRIGDVYELYAADVISPSTLPEKFDEFSQFMELCLNSPEEAAKKLQVSNSSLNNVMSIVDRYSKEARRLQVDIKQERERKTLSIRHRMESELVESDLDARQIERIVEHVVPRAMSIMSALEFEPVDSTERGLFAKNEYNRNGGILKAVASEEISGTQHFSPQAVNFLELVQKSGQDQAGVIASAIYELEDKEIKPEQKVSAQSRLRSFLFVASSKLGEMALSIGQKYLESKMGL